MVRYPGWKWWLRFKQPYWTWRDTGCFDNNHAMDGPYNGCPCNSNMAIREGVEAQGYKLVGVTFPFAPYVKQYFKRSNPYNPRTSLLIVNYHTPGR